MDGDVMLGGIAVLLLWFAAFVLLVGVVGALARWRTDRARKRNKHAMSFPVRWLLYLVVIALVLTVLGVISTMSFYGVAPFGRR